MTRDSTNHDAEPPPTAPDPRMPLVGMTRAEIDQLLDRLDATPTAEYRREGARQTYRTQAIIILDTPGPTPTAEPTRTAAQVFTRNISRGGVGFIHTSSIPTDSAIITLLRHDQLGEIRVAGKVNHVRQLDHRLFEVGVAFDHALDIRGFTQATASRNCRTFESIAPSRLEGRVLLVTESPELQQIVQDWLRPSAIDLVIARGVFDALRRANTQRFDAVVADYDLGRGTGVDLLQGLRKGGTRTPIIILSSFPARSSSHHQRPDALLPNPPDRRDFLTCLAEFLLLPPPSMRDTVDITTDLPASSPLISLIPGFVHRVRAQSDELERLLLNDNVEQFLAQASDITSTAAALGFALLARAGEHAIRAATATGSLNKSIDAVTPFLSACRRIQGGLAAAKSHVA